MFFFVCLFLLFLSVYIHTEDIKIRMQHICKYVVDKSVKNYSFILMAVLHTFGSSEDSHLQCLFVFFQLTGVFSEKRSSVSLQNFSLTASPSAVARTSDGIMKLALMRTIQRNQTELLLLQITSSELPVSHC